MARPLAVRAFAARASLAGCKRLGMSAGSRIHDKVSAHFKTCVKCREIDVENERLGSPDRRSVSAATFAAMCPFGRGTYRDYLQWLAEP